MEDKIKELEEQYKDLKEQYEHLSEQASNIYSKMNEWLKKINKCKQEALKEANRSKIGKYYYHADYDNERNAITHHYIFIRDMPRSNYFLADLIEYTVINGDIYDFQYIKKYLYPIGNLKIYTETTDKEFNDFFTYCHERNK
jgi:hypothetical protein